MHKHTDTVKKKHFAHRYGNSDGIGCKAIDEEGLPNI
jgi:hypothetical protein